MPDRVAALLMIARAEIRALEQELQDLPAQAAGPVVERIERLSVRSRRLARTAAVRLRSH